MKFAFSQPRRHYAMTTCKFARPGEESGHSVITLTGSEIHSRHLDYNEFIPVVSSGMNEFKKLSHYVRADCDVILTLRSDNHFYLAVLENNITQEINMLHSIVN